MQRHFVCLLALVASVLPSVAPAQALPEHEYDKKIQAARHLDAITADAFGGHISDATGSTEFVNVDIDLPGNNSLPVRLARRLPIDERYLTEELGGLGNWDLDVPHIEGIFDSNMRWTVDGATTAERQKRCSRALPPRISGSFFSAEEAWSGYNLHLPGEGSEPLLVDTAGTFPDPPGPTAFPWTTRSQGRVSCTATVLNAYGGEGFILHRIDGTRYTFNYPVERGYRQMQKGPKTVPGYTLNRMRIFLLATRIEDRFGNWVQYHYLSGGRLDRITSSDGRTIQMGYPSTTSITATANGRVWTYVLSGGFLSEVINPDLTSWRYSPFGSLGEYVKSNDPGLIVEGFDPAAMCSQLPESRLGAIAFDVTHPSGAEASYAFAGRFFGRANVPYRCQIDFFDHVARVLNVEDHRDSGSEYWRLVFSLMGAPANSDGSYSGEQYAQADSSASWILEQETSYELDRDVEVSGFARIGLSNLFEVASLQSVTLRGLGVLDASTTYAYEAVSFPYCDVFSTLTGTVWGQRCDEAPPVDGRWTTITRSDGTQLRKRYGVVYGDNEGLLLTEEVRTATGVVASARQLTYVSGSDQPTQAFSARIGQELLPDPMSAKVMPIVANVLVQDGSTFSYQVGTCANQFCFDGQARPLQIVRTGTGTRTESFEYHDDPALWVLGQQKTHQIGGVSVSQTTYGSAALPAERRSFGRVVETLGWNADGTLRAVLDGRGNEAILENWFRGIPRSITYPDGTAIGATVTGDGWITSVTDKAGFTTGYTHDSMGRITRIDHPVDPQAGTWHPTTIELARLSAPALGRPAGTWYKRVQSGKAVQTTYFDGLLRPVLSHEMDDTSAVSRAATNRYTAWGYDTMGRQIFAAYPRATASPAVGEERGLWTEYDALGRPSSTAQDSEQGALVTLTTYLSGGRVRVTNPRGAQTTTTHLLWDAPTYELPILVEANEGITTTITRDVVGRATRIRRTGAWDGAALAVNRDYRYNAHGQLEKRWSPEERATYFDYDLAGNAVRTYQCASNDDSTCGWTAVGGRPADVTVRTFDAMNRITKVDYPAGTADLAMSYSPDGLAEAVQLGSSVLQTYTYNSRRMPTSERLSGFSSIDWTTGYEYEPHGHLAAIIYPDGLTVDFAPNALGQATRAGNYATGATYFPNGALKEFTYGNGIVHTLTQNERGQPETTRDAAGGAVVLDDSYFYDPNGNVLAIDDALPGSAGDRAMTYDLVDRLLTAAAGPAQGGSAAFSYDPIDNIRSLTQGSRAIRHQYVAGSRLTGVTTSTGTPLFTAGYDERGNQTRRFHADGSEDDFTFDDANRLTTTVMGLYHPDPSHPAVSTTYLYDGHGRRVRETSGQSTYYAYNHAGALLYKDERKTGIVGKTAFIHLAGSLVAERFVPASGTAVTTFQHTDALGTPVAVTDIVGAIVRRNRQTSYGEPADGTWERGVGYTGHVVDAGTKLVYMQQRYYDPVIGRFLSVDPVTANSVNGGNFNRYWYANNNPYKFTDPDGRQACGSESDCIEATNFDYTRASPQTTTQTSGVDAVAASELPNNESMGNQENGLRIDESSSGNVTATPVPTTSTVAGNVIRSTMSGIAGADSIAHSHPVDTSDPSPGPGDDLAVNAGWPNNIGHDGNVIVVEMVEGQFRVRVITDANLTPADRTEIQRDVNEFQQRVQ